MLAAPAPPDIHRFLSSMVKGVMAAIATTRVGAGWQSNGEKLSRHPA